ncbi:MAG: enoyl-CoA hydratase [Candidatus Tectimicrobiota bacterium]|nr:MAG: enoyl-CoA hydratase [Candidatus Tectomicrobia bacterium]
MPPTVTYHRDGRIGYITLNRPEALNAVNDQLEHDLVAALEAFDLDEEAWVGILHGAGRCFCAGADVKQRFHGQDRQQRQRTMARGRSPEGYLGRTINWKPVIAAVHGYALGAGISIAAECDLIVASEEAQFGITETLRGIHGGRVWAKVQFSMGSKMAAEMLLTGDRYPAAELYRLGFINRLVPTGQHLEGAKALADKILQAPPLAVRAGVRILRWQWTKLVAEADYYAQAIPLHLSEDFEESARAFVEKRQPVYRAR